MTIETFTPVGSTTIASASYDTETNELRIEFQHGGAYSYDRVPRGVWDGLKTASSPGSYWHKNKGAFAFRKV